MLAFAGCVPAAEPQPATAEQARLEITPQDDFASVTLQAIGQQFQTVNLDFYAGGTDIALSPLKDHPDACTRVGKHVVCKFERVSFLNILTRPKDVCVNARFSFEGSAPFYLEGCTNSPAGLAFPESPP